LLIARDAMGVIPTTREAQLRERLSRWAAGITGAVFAVVWPLTLSISSGWGCEDRCTRWAGRTVAALAVDALILIPVGALAFFGYVRLGRSRSWIVPARVAGATALLLAVCLIGGGLV